jgi:hypothetical protein
VTAAFPVGSDPVEAPPGYPGYGATGPIGPASSGQHARPAEIPYPPAGYSPTGGQDAYSGFPYPAQQPAFGHGETGLYASPYDSGSYVQAAQPAVGYTSTDPYASDPYGYRGYGR